MTTLINSQLHSELITQDYSLRTTHIHTPNPTIHTLRHTHPHAHTHTHTHTHIHTHAHTHTHTHTDISNQAHIAIHMKLK